MGVLCHATGAVVAQFVPMLKAQRARVFASADGDDPSEAHLHFHTTWVSALCLWDTTERVEHTNGVSDHEYGVTTPSL